MAGTKKVSFKSGKKAILSPNDRAQALQEMKERETTALEDQLRASLELLETAVGGRRNIIDALVVSKHPSARKFVSIMGKVEKSKKPLYDILKKAKLSPDDLIAIFMDGTLVRSTVQTIVKLSDGLPGIMDVAVESAKIPGGEGYNDRRMLMEIAGLRKQERQGGVNINLSQIQLGGEGVFEKVITRRPVSMHDNPFDVDIVAEEVENE